MDVKKAVDFLRAGKIVIFPTDTVYGLLALASNKKAVDKIYKIKKRPKSKPLPTFVKSFAAAKELAEINKNQEKIIKKYWPGKYTFILNKKYGSGTIALRIPKYKPLNNLLKRVNAPLAQTSVNISGQPPLTKIKDILEIFGVASGVDLIINGGNLPNRKPSTIIDLIKEKNKILRK
jgi:L-threonylcarbamoyladenylate synthase